MVIKTRFDVHIGSVCAIALLSATAISEPSRAEDITFLCSTNNGVPATIARTAGREVPIILWNSFNLGESGDSRQQLCEEVSQKFQIYYNSGTLKYITTARKNGQLVACVAQKENEPCTDESLFVLNSNDTNPKATLQKIFRIRVTSTAPISETNSRIYISLDKYLNGEYPHLNQIGTRTAPIESESSPIQSETYTITKFLVGIGGGAIILLAFLYFKKNHR